MDSGPDKKTVRVTILNQTYTLQTSDEPSDVEAAAQRVDEVMTSIAARAGNLDSSRVAVLACLHIADQLRTLERELESLKGRVDAKSKQFSVLLDRAIE